MFTIFRTWPFINSIRFNGVTLNDFINEVGEVDNWEMNYDELTGLSYMHPDHKYKLKFSIDYDKRGVPSITLIVVDRGLHTETSLELDDYDDYKKFVQEFRVYMDAFNTRNNFIEASSIYDIPLAGSAQSGETIWYG